MAFAAAPEYHVFPTRERPLTPYQAVERATRETVALVRDVAPAVVISDILTLAPALAGELEGVPVGTVIPHLDPRMPDGSAPYSCGARLPRTRAGRALWRGADPLLRHGLQLGRRQLNETRRRLGLPALERVHGGISEALTLVATFPQLEYPRAWPAGTHVVGPLMWEPPAPDVGAAAGRGPARADRAVDLAGSRPDAAARRAGGPRGPAGARARVGEPADPVRHGGSAQRPARRLGLLLARDAGLRSRRLPRRARHRRARAGERMRRRDRPGRRRHERERRARRVGGRRRAAARPPPGSAWAGARRRAARSPGRHCARAPAACRPGRSATTEPSRAADLVEGFAAQAGVRSGSCGR